MNITLTYQFHFGGKGQTCWPAKGALEMFTKYSYAE